MENGIRILILGFRTRLSFPLIIGALCLVAPWRQARADCQSLRIPQPPVANTTRPQAPFFIDLSGMTLDRMPPRRDPHDAHYPAARDLPDGSVPPVTVNGNFVLGPTHPVAHEFATAASVPHGRVVSFTMDSGHSVLFRNGIARDDPDNCPNGAIYTAHSEPGDPSDLRLMASHPAPWTRQVDVYVPAQYRAGTRAPFVVFGDGGADGIYPGRDLFAVLDVLIASHRLPPMIAIGVGAGGQDAQGSERGLEYDTASGTYAEWVEREVLPLAQQQAGVSLTRDPDGRATMGVSSSGGAAFGMAWFHPDLYHRVLAYSPTLTNQQWPHDPAMPGGAWQYHSPWAGAPNATGKQPGAALMPDAPRAPIRFWFAAGDQDLFYPAPAMPDGMHDWVLASENMARVLGRKGYDYQFVLSRNAGHIDGATIAQTLPEALLWLWQDYTPKQD
ncbi:esterase [Novacetimonas pomaceti]|uniref:Esterase n=1 Tax=Novacetimonas pomaceti TaxID=2021998 RepID=A0ABX5P6B6_9PROT|nr:esterase [Novacetimonas pomaceti]